VNLEIVLHLAVNADVTVIGKRMFTDLADIERPEENLVKKKPSRKTVGRTCTTGRPDQFSACSESHCSLCCGLGSFR
jgi:hypothetical protein